MTRGKNFISLLDVLKALQGLRISYWSTQERVGNLRLASHMRLFRPEAAVL
jgi:hypothetical protein